MTELDPYLRPMAIAGEVVRFDLSSFRSTVTRDMLQLRIRMTPDAFHVGDSLLAANVTAAGELEVDAEGLESANAVVRSRLENGPEGAVGYLRDLTAARASLDRSARSVAGRARASFVSYVLAAGRYQALGALKFCLPDTLRPTLMAWLGDPALVDGLLSPEEPSLWSVVQGSELALARHRLRSPAALYARRLVRHQRAYGYLYAEDVDFRDHESTASIDARVAALGTDGVEAQRRRLADVLAADRARKAHARRVFAESLADREGVVLVVSHVLLARALAAHEDLNRRAKMRFLRDLRDLAEPSGLDVEHDGLARFAAACTRPAREAVGTVRPVLRST